MVIINTDDNLNFYPQATDDAERPEIATLIISKTDGDKLIKDRQSITTLTLAETDLQDQDLYQLSNLYASDDSGIDFTVVLKDVVYVPYDAYYGTSEVKDKSEGGKRRRE